MPATQVLFYCEADGTSPVVDWLRELREADEIGFLNCLARVELLESTGHELRRPAADFLRDGIYELRAKHGHVQYRLLYFFAGRNIAAGARHRQARVSRPGRRYQAGADPSEAVPARSGSAYVPE